MTDKTDSKEREAFEAWIKKDSGDLSAFGSGVHKHYRNSADNGALNFVTARAFRIIARAVLTKWGAPPAVTGGPVAAHRVMRKRLDGEWVCESRYWCDGPPSKELVESICADKDRWRVDVSYTTPPAQAADSVLEDAARLEQIAEAIRDYHHALDLRKHGGLAESAAFSSICNTMGMHWSRGEEAARRAARKQGANHD